MSTPYVRVLPFTIAEALYGNQCLDPSVVQIRHNFPQPIRQRLSLFHHLLDRPKQSLHHLFELFIIHICTIPDNPTWVSEVSLYLASVSDHFVPDIQPATCHQWAAITLDPSGNSSGTVDMSEEYYPSTQTVNAKSIVDIISSYSESFTEPPLTFDQLANIPLTMDQPVIAAVVAYAYFLHTHEIKNGWLRSFFQTIPARRERARTHSQPLLEHGRIRVKQSLHTLFSAPFVNNRGHLIWYAANRAKPSNILSLPTACYARSNIVRIHSTNDHSKYIQVHVSRICNKMFLDMRLWQSWTHNMRGVGQFCSLANPVISIGAVRFDHHVLIEGALAVGFRLVNGLLYNPAGVRMVVRKRKDDFYVARTQVMHHQNGRGKRAEEKIDWQSGMRFV